MSNLDLLRLPRPTRPNHPTRIRTLGPSGSLFREQTSSEALGTFTCASCGGAVPLRSHRSLSLSQFDVDVLKRPDLSANEENLLDRYKWLHPASTPAPMPFDELPFLARALPSAPTPRCLTVFA
ncbi:hypothetical protein B0H13DRAFT_2340450 [Mycena leptocephala]|nr:hypothetical protein B0H13DRAFT_2340450 [Mycena leptocephala]